tara:strand:- start:1387 stop:1563 length:177 start_codon:yes stop_codon:yes gene_type:complete
MRKFFSPKGQIRLIKKALASDTQYSSEELIKLKTSLKKLEKEVEEERQFQNGGFGYDI